MGSTRWVTLGFVLMAVLVAITMSKALGDLAGMAGVSRWDIELIGRDVTVSTAFAWIGAFVAAVYYFRHEKWHELATEVVVELRKVVWPSRAETRQATIVVVITTVIIAVILYLFDAVWSGVTSWIYT